MEPTKKLENATIALKILQKYNHINNDLQAYLYEVGEYGLGNRETLPTREEYGL